MQSLPDNLPFKNKILELILNASYQRNNVIHSYEGLPQKSLKSKVYFFKPKEDMFSIHGHELSQVINLNNNKKI